MWTVRFFMFLTNIPLEFKLKSLGLYLMKTDTNLGWYTKGKLGGFMELELRRPEDHDYILSRLEWFKSF